MRARYVCSRCGVPCGYWYHGWKHQNSGTTGRKSCGRRPDPVEVEDDVRSRA